MYSIYPTHDIHQISESSSGVLTDGTENDIILQRASKYPIIVSVAAKPLNFKIGNKT